MGVGEGGENNKKKENGGGKNNNITVVLKAELHCDGCASKLIKCIRSFDGVDTVTAGDGQKITVVGKVDPVKLRERVEQKTHKKVELVLPAQPKKDNKENSNGGDKKKESKENKNSNDKSSSDQKKSEKEPPVTTAVLKVNLHCDGCIQKIYKTVSRTKGYQDMKIDKQKDLVTVTGATDMKALAELLQKQLKKDVTIVMPPKKESGEKKEKDDKGKNDEKMQEGNRMMHSSSPMVGYNPYPFMHGPVAIGDQFHYSPYAGGNQFHAPQMFSDENPNACSVM